MRKMQKRFTSKFLRRWYVELVLTRSNQKLTFFHLMYGVSPALGFGLGLGIVKNSVETTVSWPNKAMFIFGGAVVGGILAWFLPRVLWKIFYRLSRIDSLTETVEDESAKTSPRFRICPLVTAGRWSTQVLWLER